MKHKKSFFLKLVLITLFYNSLFAQVDSSNTINLYIGNANFKESKVEVLKILKWSLPVLSIISGGGYYYFNKKANDNYSNYLNANTREQAVDYRTKTKDNDELASICGVTAIGSAVISTLIWLFNSKEPEENFEEYKFILVYGRELNGYIISEDFDTYQIKTKDGIIVVKRSDIYRIEKNGLILYKK